MSPCSSSSRAQPGTPAQDWARPEPGHPVRVPLLPRGLMALLAGLVPAAIALVPSPEQQEPESLAPVILRGHTGRVHAVAFAPDGHTPASGGEDQLARPWDVTAHGRAPRVPDPAGPC